MSSSMRSLTVPRSEPTTTKWARRRDIPIAVLASTAVVFVVLWGAGHIVRTILLLIIAALLAYALAPGVKVLHARRHAAFPVRYDSWCICFAQVQHPNLHGFQQPRSLRETLC